MLKFAVRYTLIKYVQKPNSYNQSDNVGYY